MRVPVIFSVLPNGVRNLLVSWTPRRPEGRRFRAHSFFRLTVPRSQSNRGEKIHEREENHPSPARRRN